MTSIIGTGNFCKKSFCFFCQEASHGLTLEGRLVQRVFKYTIAGIRTVVPMNTAQTSRPNGTAAVSW